MERREEGAGGGGGLGRGEWFVGRDESETINKHEKETNQVLSRLLHHMKDEDLNKNPLESISRTFK